MKNFIKLKNTNRLVIKTKDPDCQKLIISRGYLGETKFYQLVILNATDEPVHNSIIDVNKICINRNSIKIIMEVIENYNLEQYDEIDTTPIYEGYIPFPEDDTITKKCRMMIKEMNIEYIRGDIYLIEELIDENILNTSSSELRTKLDIPVYDVLEYDSKKKRTKKISTHFETSQKK